MTEVVADWERDWSTLSFHTVMVSNDSDVFHPSLRYPIDHRTIPVPACRPKEHVQKRPARVGGIEHSHEVCTNCIRSINAAVRDGRI